MTAAGTETGRTEFRLTADAIAPEALRAEMERPAAGALVVFEGWVRDHQDGRAVTHLEYEAYPAMALAEGGRLLEELAASHPVLRIRAVHRVGRLEIGELAVWVGICAAHRDAAFEVCRLAIDGIKARVPIWKKEYFHSGDAHWVNAP